MILLVFHGYLSFLKYRYIHWRKIENFSYLVSISCSRSKPRPM